MFDNDAGKIKIFLPLVGQFTNIGDTMHRRVLINFLKDQCELNLYIGKANKSFLAGLELGDNCKTYKNFFSWYLSAIINAKKSHFIYNSGEITGGKIRFLKEVILMPLLSWYRFLNRNVLKVGVDIQKLHGFHGFLYLLSNYFTSYTFYRTNESFQSFGNGEVIPDLAFYKYDEFVNLEKKYIIISLRDDAYERINNFAEAVIDYSMKNDLEIVVVAQVIMDNNSCVELGNLFKSHGCDCIIVKWEVDVSHISQEKKLEYYYGHGSIIVSDRLHVLISACNVGCKPVCLASYYSSKVNRHFAVLGINDIVYNIKNMSRNEILEIFNNTALRSRELMIKFKLAHEKLDAVKIKLQNFINY